MWQLERVQFVPFAKVIPMQNDVVEKSENSSSEILFDTTNNEYGAPKRPLNEPFASDFVKRERAVTLKREKARELGRSTGHRGEKSAYR